MLVEGAPFETRHGKPCLGTAALLKRFQLAQGQSTHTGIEVKMQLGLRARLTGIQRRKLLGVPEEKLDLEACFVSTIKRLRIQVGIAAVNGTERCPVFGKIRCPIFCTLRDSNLGCYPEAALPSSSFTATLSIPALRLVLSR